MTTFQNVYNVETGSMIDTQGGQDKNFRLSKAFIAYVDRATENIGQKLQRFTKPFAISHRETLIKSAFTSVFRRHKEWVDAGVDEHFLTHKAAPLVESYLNEGILPDAAAIANAWADQFCWKPETREKAIKRFMPAAQDFVYVLSTETQLTAVGHSPQ